MRALVRIVFAILLVLVAREAFATDAYVAPASNPPSGWSVGSDSNSCLTQLLACATVSHADTVVTAGGTIHVASGTYPVVNTEFTYTKAGTSGSRITVQCVVRLTCRIIPGVNSATSDPVFIGNGATGSGAADYNTFDGFEIDGSNYQGGTPWSFGLFGYGTGMVFSNNNIHHIGIRQACTSNGGSTIEISGYYGATGGTITGNLLHDNGATGCNQIQVVYVGGPNQTISNNIIYNNSAADAIEQWHEGTASTIENNLIFNNLGDAGGITIGNGEPDPGAPGVRGAKTSVTVSTGTTLTFTATPAITDGWAAWNDSSGYSCWPANTTIVSHTATTITLSHSIGCTVTANTSLLDFFPLDNSTVVTNNISVGNFYGISEFGAVGSGTVYDHNLIEGNTSLNTHMNVGTVTNTISSPPLYTNGTIAGSPAADYHPTTASPQYHAGTATHAPSTDMDGVSFNNPPSVGPYEYTVSPLTLSGPATIGSSVGSSAAGNPASLRIPQLVIQGYSGSDYGSCLSIINSNPMNLSPKSLCVDNNGSLVTYGSTGQKLATFFDNGAIGYGNFANPHGNLGATCYSNIGLSAAGGAGIVQNCRYTLAAVNTSSASTKTLTADTNAAGSKNCINMPDNSAGTFSIQLNAIDVTTPANSYNWTLGSGSYFKGVGAANMHITNLGTPIATGNGTTTGAAVALSADTTNGCFKLTFTNPATSDIWSEGAYVDVIESPPQ